MVWDRWVSCVRAMLRGAAPEASSAYASCDRIEDALQNIDKVTRLGRVGYATFWDGNKYIQCRREADQSLLCEAAGTAMQPSLDAVLTGERRDRLASLGWVIDPSFGNYVHIFPADASTRHAAEHIRKTLKEGYDADICSLQVETTWMWDVACPPRNGPCQNLAGLINDAAAMRADAVVTCSYDPPPPRPPSARSVAELCALYEETVAAEIQRLRINISQNVFVAFDAGIGYVQCAPDASGPAIYCEAQSEQSWPALQAILTPDRVSALLQMGYAEPGRAQNYWKLYPIRTQSDTAIAREILTVLHKAYGYTNATQLTISTE
ncbi:MAG: hypothetical protein AB1592_04185 [Pseudomonadota bacterium]